MKRILFISIFLFLFHAIDAQAANWYVRPSGGSGSGTSWTAAWNGLGGISWSSVSCGDTIWVAGGTYGWMNPMKACTSGSPLSIRRARSDASACTSASGWSSGYDSTVIQDNGAIAFDAGTNNYITISGRTTASGGGYGWHIYNHYTSGQISTNNGVYGIMMWSGAIVNYLAVEYMEIEGPNINWPDPTTWGSRGISQTSWVGGSSNNTYSHLKIHGWSSGIFAVAASNYLFEYIDMYDISANGSSIHPNLIYIKDTDNGVIRYSNFYNSVASGSGIAFSDGGHFDNWKIYGNKFYDMNTSSGTAIGLQTGGVFGGTGVISGLKIYNNTFSNNSINFNMYGSCGTGCETKNNIFHGYGGSITCGTTSNNLTTSSSSIFQNYSAKDFHIVSTTGTGYPRDAGTSLSSYFTTDAVATTFGGDGAWDIGAYSYNTGGGDGSNIKVSAPMNLHIIN